MNHTQRNVRTAVIVGGVAGGASAAARLRRLSEDIEIIVLERSGYVSFANCGLPYHLSATISDRNDLLLQTPESLRERFRLDVRINSEVTTIDRARRVLDVTDLTTGASYQQPYDALVLSPGAAPIVPDVPGADRALVLRDIEDLDRMVAAVDGAHNVTVVGGGFVGLEAAENLSEAGLNVTVVELANQVLAPLDPEMAAPLARELADHGVTVRLGVSVTEIRQDAVVLSDGAQIAADVVLFAIGVRPEAGLATAAGLPVGERGGIVVDANQQTMDPRIWAVGDAVEKVDLLDGSPTLTPLANIANRQGRRAADSILGRPSRVRAAQGTAIVKVFGISAATTGWNEKRLRAAGRDFLAIHTHPNDHAAYYPGASTIAIKLLVDPHDGAILGAQAVGHDGIDKRIDVIATAMRAGLKATDLIDLELAYAPPFGSAKDPINQLGYVAENRLSGLVQSIDWSELSDMTAAGWTLVDVRSAAEFVAGAIPGAINMPLDDLRAGVAGLRSKRVIVYCKVGQRAHVAARLLAESGIEVRNLDGGWLTWEAGHAASELNRRASAGVEIVRKLPDLMPVR